MNRINFVEGIPKYKQIAGNIKMGVISCQIKPGERLPSAGELSRTLKVNISTVARAYQLLKNDGFLKIQRKAGTSVLSSLGHHRVLVSRQSQLAAMADKTILDSLGQGYSPDELETALRSQLKQVEKQERAYTE